MSIRLLLDEPKSDNPKEVTCKLVTHVIHVINILKENCNGINEQYIEDLQLEKFAKSITSKHSLSLRNIYDEIKGQGKITEQPFNIFLASYCAVSNDKRTEASYIQARIILSAEFLSRQQGYDDVIKRAVNACRLIFTDSKCVSILNALPSFTLELNELIKQITNQKNKTFSGGHHLAAIIALFKMYLKRSPKYHPRKITGREVGTTTGNGSDYKEVTSAYVPDIGEHEVREFAVEPIDKTVESFNIDEQERSIDQQSVTRYFDIKLVASDEINQSLALQNQLVKTTANHIFRREKQLTCDYRQLSQYDVSCLVKHCFINISQAPCYAYLLAILFTGRSLNNLINHQKQLKIVNRKPFNNQPIWISSPKLPNHEVAANLEVLLNRPNGKVILVLPSQLTQALSQRLPIEHKLSEEITGVIKEINQRKSTRLTLARIQNYLSFYLNSQGVDATEIALILGKSIEQEPGCSYYQVEVSKLRCIHQDFVSKMMANTDQHLTHVITQSSGKLVGSRLIVKTEKIVRLFQALSERLSSLRQQGWDGLESFHNLYVIYIITLLNLATGHRPVRHPYETIDCFDLEAGTVFISDKESRSALSARVIPLPAIAITQVKYYLKHLDTIQNLITNLAPDIGEKIYSARGGEEPLLFFLNDLKITPVTPGRLEAYCSDIWPLKMNWHRHFMRTWLRAQGIHGHTVDTWMGHIGTGGDGFSRYSALAMRDTRDIAEKINEFFLNTLHIEAENPWIDG